MRWVIDATRRKFKMALGISWELMPGLEAAAAPVHHAVARGLNARLCDVALALDRETGEKC